MPERSVYDDEGNEIAWYWWPDRYAEGPLQPFAPAPIEWEDIGAIED